MRREWLVGRYELHEHGCCSEAGFQLESNPPPRSGTNFCHILPPSTNWGLNPNDPVEKKLSLFSFIICFLLFNVLQKKYAGNVWVIINTFRSIIKLDGTKIHCLENGIYFGHGLAYRV
jgi:hypothetical protein